MTVTIAQAKEGLKALIAKANSGEEIVITEDEKPIAQIVPAKPRPQFGSCRDMIEMFVDDDEHLKDFEDYMP
jgi:prevent-host-death family protein